VADCTRHKGKVCRCKQCYPYTHHAPNVYGSRLVDYLVSEMALREDYPEMFEGRD
jgi:hypothetical protein